MQLDLDDVVRLFGVPEDAVLDWIRDGEMPCNRVGGHYRFNRAELLEWASAHGKPVPPALMTEAGAGTMPTLEDALRAGGVHGDLEGADKVSVLKSMVGRLPLPPAVDKDWFLQMLLARESLASTGIGDGIAIPHVRHPILMRVPRPLVTLCYLRNPVDFDAVDGQPVRVLFTLISPTVKTHLHLLARLGFAVGHEPFREALRRRAPAADMLSAAAAIDQRCREAAGAPAT